MRKWVSYLIPIVSLILFIVVMQGGGYYLTSLSDRDIIPAYVEQVNMDLRAERWDDARENLNRLDLAWKKTIPKIQYHAEMDAIDGIKMNISRLNGSIDARDLGLSLAELNELSEHWENLTN
ncbi:MAG: DUF4363 family protein [Syntrophomonas sp.]|nr:DUF4363 family protein [Syntrophomonas sp.]